MSEDTSPDNGTRYAYCDHIGELRINLRDARGASHTGACDEDVAALRQVPYIAEQLDKLDAAKVVAYLREFGAWDDEELAANHQANLDRVLWLACGNVVEDEHADG